MRYKVEYLFTNKERSSHHLTAILEDKLNELGKDNWLLDKMIEVSIGYLLIFQKL